MKSRIELFLKGNADIVDPIYGVRGPAGANWGGLNALFRELGWPVTARVRHETAIGFDTLTGAPVALPEDVAARAALFGTFHPAQQHSQALFQGNPDAVLLSLQPDIGILRWRHRASFLPFALHDAQRWPEPAHEWRRTAFEPQPLVAPDAAMAALLEVVTQLQRDRDLPIVVANMTSVAPGETLHAFLGLPPTLSQRVRQFNLALEDAARQADFSILDIDRIVALGGAERLIYDRMHFSLDGCRRVAAELARILEERGVIDA